jgi:hypothetical protein
MYIKLYIDTGAVGHKKECRARCHELYPELCNTIHQIGDKQPSDEIVRSAHGLLRVLAREIDEKTRALSKEHLPTAWFIDSEEREDTP